MKDSEHAPLRGVEAALVLGLSCGAIDQVLAILDKPSGFESFVAVLPPFAATAFVVFAGFLAALVPIRALAGATSLDESPLVLASAALVFTSFAVASFSDLFRSPLDPVGLFRWLLTLAFSGVVAAAAYLATVGAARSATRRRLASGVLRSAPFLLTGVLIFAWVQVYVSLHPVSVVSLSTSSAIAVVSFLVLRGFLGTRPPGNAALWGLAASLVLLPAIGGAVLARVGAHTPAPTTGERTPRHVLLISVDTLRADRLSCYSGDRGVPTPSIDSLAEDGVLFEKPTSSAPWTLGSLASILTGLSPSIHSVVDIHSRLPETVTTLAESLQLEGYHTGAVVLNDLLHPRSNLRQGFEDYGFLTFPSYGRSIGRRVLQRAAPAWFPVPAWPTTDDVTDSAVSWLERNRESDFFLWVHYYDPHAPFEPPERYLPDTEIPPGMGRRFGDQKDVLSGLVIPGSAERTWIETLYSAEVKYLDDNMGRLLDSLKQLDIYDDALIVFTADHGEEFWEHGAHGHGHTMYDELLAVPLVVKLPGATTTGRVEARVATESVTPTVLDLCGIDFDPRRHTAPPLTPFLAASEGASPESPEAIVSTSQVLFDRQETVYFDGYKYIRSLIGDQQQLFDLKEDPNELSPLALDDAEIVGRAKAYLEEHAERSQRLRERFDIQGMESVEFDNETLEKLRGLGYIR